MADNVVEIDRGWNAIKRELAKANGSAISVGIQEGPQAAPGLSVAQVGAFHEFGLGVPQRSWLGSTIEEKADDLADLADRLYWRGVLAGKVTAGAALRIIGQAAEDAVKAKIRDSDPEWPPLAASAKRQKARTIRGASERGAFISGDGNPLVDTGQMLNSIRYSIDLVDARGAAA